VAIRQLAEDFGRYLYLPRLREAGVLAGAVEDGLGLLLWANDSFAYADSYDEAEARYRGLRGGQRITVSADSPDGLLVKPEVARRQLDTERPPEPSKPGEPPPQPSKGGGQAPEPPKPAAGPRRYHGSVALDPARVGRDAGRIAEEVIAHLAGLVGAEVRVTLEIEARIPGGAPDNVVRIVTENGRTLKFASHGFEKE
jgi:hypothetical protein